MAGCIVQWGHAGYEYVDEIIRRKYMSMQFPACGWLLCLEWIESCPCCYAFEGMSVCSVLLPGYLV